MIRAFYNATNSFWRQAMGYSRLRWWMMCYLPAWPWKRCVECGRVFRRRPWWFASAFEEHCSRKCCDDEMDRADAEFDAAEERRAAVTREELDAFDDSTFRTYGSHP